MKAALQFEAVTKAFGDRFALNQMSFTIPDGVINGFIGPNGAGKTTAFSVVSGYLLPDSGRVEILGEAGFDPWRLKGRLGVLPQDAELPGRHRPAELLVHLARLQGLTRAEAERDAARTLALVRLDGRTSDPIDALSHGMRRRVAVATALLGTPELVLLDEPTAGLDPVQALSLRDALAEMRGRVTLVVSSHNLMELERLCDHVVMVDGGRCVRQGTVSEVTGQTELISCSLGPGTVDVAALAAAIPGATVKLVDRELTLAVRDGDPDLATVGLMRALCDAGVPIRELRRGLSLEQRFVEDAASAR